MLIVQPLEYLARLQAEAASSGFHPDLKAWVDSNSGAARVLVALAAEEN